MCAFVCVYTYTHMHTYTHIQMYVCIYTIYLVYKERYRHNARWPYPFKYILKCSGLVSAEKVINSEHVFSSYIGKFLKTATLFLYQRNVNGHFSPWYFKMLSKDTAI